MGTVGSAWSKPGVGALLEQLEACSAPYVSTEAHALFVGRDDKLYAVTTNVYLNR